MKIALIQQHATHNKQENMERGIRAFKQAAGQGAKLICFAEVAFEPFFPQNKASGSQAHLAESIPGPMTETFQKLAKEFGVVTVLNLFEKEGEHTYDTSPVIDADGRLLGKTQMVHIPNYESFHEQCYYTTGKQGTPVYETAVGKEEKLTFSGESFVCNPEGQVIARAAEGKDEILICDIDLEQTKTSHAQRWFLKDRRPELYSGWI